MASGYGRVGRLELARPPTGLVNECATPHPGWIWCDDFDQDRMASYFEVDRARGSFGRVSGVGNNGSWGMRARFAAGQVSAGSLKLAFGRTPGPYFRAVDGGVADYRELYWRLYLRNAPGWTGGGGNKLSRMTVFATSGWSQAMIAPVWSGGPGSRSLMLDPVSGTDPEGRVRTTKYNDLPNLRWLGQRVSRTPIFDPAHVGQWRCIEAHVRLNDAGRANGVFELWIDGRPEASRAGLNWLGTYSAYGLNALFLENYWNAGSPVAQERYFDNLVVSTEPIGC